MDQPSFTSVTQDGFLALGEELGQGAWATIDVTPFFGADGALIKPICQAPTVGYFKIELLTTIAGLSGARSSTYGASGLDRIWDGLQRQLNLTLSTFATDPDANKRAAAKRLQGLLLLGGGTGQTKLKYHQEVDFGRKQVKVVSQGEAAADAALLGLGGLITSITKATEDLAAGIGHGSTEERPSEQVRVARAACASACSWVADGLSRLVARSEPGADRELATKLLETLTTLAARYPAIPPKEKKEPSAPTGPTGPTGPSTPTEPSTPTGPTGPTGPSGP